LKSDSILSAFPRAGGFCGFSSCICAALFVVLPAVFAGPWFSLIGVSIRFSERLSGFGFNLGLD